MKHVSLEDICDIQIGKTPSRSVQHYWGGNLPWVTISDFVEGRTITRTKEGITRIGAKESGSKLIEQGTLLLSFKLSLGKRAIAGRDLFTNEAIAALRLRGDRPTDRDYLYWALGSVDYDRLVDRAAKGKTLNKAKLKKIQVPLPAFAEQKRIAHILDVADALRAKRRESLAQLESLLQSTFLDMFGDPVTNPKGWEKERMGNIMRIRRGGSPRPIDKYLGGTINWVKIGDATRSRDDLYLSSCAEKISPDGLSKTTLLEPGSLVFANSGVSLGFARILKVQGAIHDGWLAFDDYDGERLDQIFFLKTLNAITEHFRRIAPSGTQPNLNTGIMKAFELILPPISEQRCFASIVESVERQKARMRTHLAELDALFASLQSRAFSGEL